jgi:hypothetical protein
MMRLSTLVWLSLVGAMVAGLFHLKYEVAGLEKRLAQAKRDTRVHREAVGILEAEWAYLSRPGRLAGLLRKRVDLMPLTRQQVTTFDRLERKLATEIAHTGPEESNGQLRPAAHTPPGPRRRPER